ncbi:hypothetical protein LPN04_28190 [Rugamonas sp. A1-17]|nr:hypothetical protein [Rugamonas sp. A1-17]
MIEFEDLCNTFATDPRVVRGKMFGKECLKIGGKAFLAQQGSYVVFKLNSPLLEQALALDRAVSWDPSGKGRPMREWVALPAENVKKFKKLAQAALSYVESLT